MDPFASVRQCYVTILMPYDTLERLLSPCVALESLTVYSASRHDFALTPSDFPKLTSVTLHLMSELEEEDIHDGFSFGNHILHLGLSTFSLTTLHIVDSQDRGYLHTSQTMGLLYKMDAPPTLRRVALKNILPDHAVMVFLARHWLQFDDVEIQVSSTAELNHRTNGYLLNAVVEFLLNGIAPNYQFLTDSEVRYSRPTPLVICYGFGYRSVRVKNSCHVKGLGLGLESVTYFDDLDACPLSAVIRQCRGLSELEEFHIQLNQWPWGDRQHGVLDFPDMLVCDLSFQCTMFS